MDRRPAEFRRGCDGTDSQKTLFHPRLGEAGFLSSDDSGNSRVMHPIQPPSPPDSLSAAITNPDMFVGKQVRISGFMYVSWEGGGLFETPAELKSYNTENAIELLIPTKKLGPLDDYDGTFGVVAGTFEANRSPGWRATIVVDEISPIFRFSPPYRPTPADPENLPDGILKTMREDTSKDAGK